MKGKLFEIIFGKNAGTIDVIKQLIITFLLLLASVVSVYLFLVMELF